jgi:hypothetical protein
VGVASTVTWSWQGGNCQWLGTLQLNHEVRTQPDRHQPSKVTHSHGVRCDTQTGRGGGGSKPGVAADSPESWVYSECQCEVCGVPWPCPRQTLLLLC